MLDRENEEYNIVWAPVVAKRSYRGATSVFDARRSLWSLSVLAHEEYEGRKDGSEWVGRGASEGGGTGRPFDICPFTLHSVAQK